ncbi:MAG: alpha-1,3-glucosyltransferase [Bacillariaceae sp.]|jgi:alpha-1,3-glucosyltransferase
MLLFVITFFDTITSLIPAVKKILLPPPSNIVDGDNRGIIAMPNNDSSTTSSCNWNFLIFFWSFIALLRIAIGFQPHSGQDNYHGSADKGAYGGDFEAQRHWMELTIHLPIGDWYWYDLEYWGLDYPPLTAYVSWICGWASYYIVGEESVAFESSRGIEDPNHKAFMRTTVLLLDLLVFGNAVWYATEGRDRKSLWAIMIALCQPAIILIDHGHFQYNSVALGLSIASFSFMVQSDFASCVWGGFLFTLALNFKQMTLYYGKKRLNEKI